MNGMKHLLACSFALLALVLSPVVVRAQTSILPPDDSATASPTPRPRPKPSPTPDPSVPVGTVNGFAVYRPLLKSEVADPINRALIIYDFNRHEAKLPAARLDAAVRDFIRARFNGDEGKLDGKLKTLGATRADFREFVGEEAKVHLMLANVGRGSVSEESARRAQNAYIAGLRAHAAINTPRS